MTSVFAAKLLGGTCLLGISLEGSTVKDKKNEHPFCESLVVHMEMEATGIGAGARGPPSSIIVAVGIQVSVVDRLVSHCGSSMRSTLNSRPPI